MTRYFMVFVVVGGLASVSCTGPRQGAPAGAESCTACHGDPGRTGDELRRAAPPLSVHLEGQSGRSDPGFVGVGAHDSHLGEGDLTAPVACAECHQVPMVDGQLSVAASGHLDGVVELTFGGRAIAGDVSAAYDRATNSCTVYCHGATLTGGSNTHPQWTAVGQGQAECGSCHGVPPPPPHPASAPDRCWTCHPAMHDDGTLDPERHIDGKVDLTPPTCHSCHGSAANAAPPADTAGRTDEHLPSVGAHQAHVTEGAVARAFACSACHATDPSQDPTHIYDHIDGIVELPFGTLAATGGVTPTYDPTTNTCTNYCHAPPGGGGRLHTPDWTRVDGTQAVCGTCHGLPPENVNHPQSRKCHLCHPTVDKDLNFVDKTLHVNGVTDLIQDFSCNRCHGSADNPAPPVDTNGVSDTSSVTVGAHQSHLVPDADAITAPITCDACHNPVPTSDDPLAHINGVAAVNFGDVARADGATPLWNGTTCSVYCHGQTLSGGSNTTPEWTNLDGSQDACGSCHGLPPTEHHPPSAPTACGDCHLNVSYTAGNWVFADVSKHVNGTVEVKSLACNSCHGNANNAAPPVDTLGRSDPTLPSVGAHQAHVVDGPFATAIPCGECHITPTDLSHIDGTAQVVFGPVASAWGVTPSFNGTTCTVHCHGGASLAGSHMTPAWTGGSSEVACGSCHGLPPVNDAHPSVGPTSCSQCHGDVINADLSWKDKSLHINGHLEYRAP